LAQHGSSIARTRSGLAPRAKAPPRRQRNRAGRPTAHELERRKATVMQVATDLFIAHGYAGTTLLDIAKVSGVATRTLYQHFGDKEAIFQDVIFARDTAVIDKPQVADGESLPEVLRKTARYAFEVALRPRSIELMRLMIAESARFPEMMSKVGNIIFTRFLESVAQVFAQLEARKLIPPGDHAQSAELFADLVLGNRSVMIYFGWANATAAEKDIDAKVDLFISGRFRNGK
jgi:TetR/AcrR family transcriptional regulator, mexJK operon transcriptional repressor